MKKIIVLVLAILTFACENASKKEVILTADAEGIAENSKVFLSKLGENNQQVHLDTTEVVNETFSFDLSEQDEQELNIVRIDGAPGNFIFVKEDMPMHLKVDYLNVRNSSIEAGKHNSLLLEYFNILKNLNEEMQDVQKSMNNAMRTGDQAQVAELRSIQRNIEKESVDKRKLIVEENPSSIVSLMILSDLINQKKVNNKEAKDYFENFSNEVKDLQLGRNLQEQIAKVGATDIGAVAPDFSGPTPEGNKLNLKDAMGKVTLIDFWASWCKPCRIENPNIVDVYQDYKDKGLSIVQVSLDKQNQKKSWTNAIEADNLGDWHHVSNLMFWKDPIAVKYGVRSIPKAYLIDENGVIIGKDLRGNQLREKVSEYLD
ncbi:TlpA disulfide reductase family protein [Psychroflexus planctonicus]|uniref:Thiol:disulfide interchange protein n=1 Tax=Psychroflexus planctonicus TaxID=1526575 RepID=A0ABQ1SKX4_9FLAO|nr:TlpA disulfide reductase family protein [Psychroflexus planctonicus]GGE39792.1 thiol:disulfide interchange protein [Psychroflexus planctonicus]